MTDVIKLNKFLLKFLNCRSVLGFFLMLRRTTIFFKISSVRVQVRLQNTTSYIKTMIINVLRQLQSKFGLTDKIIVYRAGVTISQFEQVS